MKERDEITPSWAYLDIKETCQTNGKLKKQAKGKRIHARLASRADVIDFATVLESLYERVLHYLRTNDSNDLWLVSDVRKAMEDANTNHETLIEKRLIKEKNKYSDNE